MYISTHSLTKRLTTNTCLSTKDYNISTHSLTKRLTDGFNVPEGLVKHFNSQPHEEADEAVTLFEAAIKYFNSQPHEEADDGIQELVDGYRLFQLTASRRG